MDQAFTAHVARIIREFERIRELNGKLSEKDQAEYEAVQRQMVKCQTPIDQLPNDGWVICAPVQNGYTWDQIEDFRRAPMA